jgi:hypothetical protein
MLGGESIVDDEGSYSGSQRDARGEPSMGGDRPDRVAAAVQVEEDAFALGLGSFDPLGWNSDPVHRLAPRAVGKLGAGGHGLESRAQGLDVDLAFAGALRGKAAAEQVGHVLMGFAGHVGSPVGRSWSLPFRAGAGRVF